MKAQDVAAKVRELTLRMTQVKICGITNLDDAHGGRRRRGRRARLHLRREHAAVRDAGPGGAHRARAAAVRHAGRRLLGPSGRPHQAGGGGVRAAGAAVPRRREAGGPREYTPPVIKTIKLPPAKALAGFPEGQTEDFARVGPTSDASPRSCSTARSGGARAAPGIRSSGTWPDDSAPAGAGSSSPVGSRPTTSRPPSRRWDRTRWTSTPAWKPRRAERITTRCGASSARPSARCSCEPAARRAGPLRPLRWALRARDADGAADRAGESLRGGPARPEVSSTGSTGSWPTTPGGPRRSTSPRA